MKYIIFLVSIAFILSSCQTTNNSFTNQELKKNYEFVESVLKNIDSLNLIISDTSKVITTISEHQENIRIVTKWLKEYLLENKFTEGFDYVDEDIYYMKYNSKLGDYSEENTRKAYTHGIKLKSKYNGEIIWFLFGKDAISTSKYKGFEKCNNYLERVQELKYVIPCDKE